MSLFIFETILNDEIIIIKIKIKYFTHITITSIFVIKNITFHKCSLSALAFIESITFKITIIIEFFLSSTNSLFIYRIILFLSFAYKLYKKLYFTITNLYIRYTSLSKFTIIRIIIVFFIMFI